MYKQQMFKIYIFLFALLLSGCSSITELRLDLADKIFGRETPNQPAELKPISVSQTVRKDWSYQLEEIESYDLVPALEAGFVFAADAEGNIAKVEVQSGRQSWRINVGEPITGGVGVGGGLVLVGTKRGNIFAYDMSGKLIWQSKLSSEVLSVPRYVDTKVIVRSGDNRVYGLDAADGTRRWVYERQMPALSLRSSAGVVVNGGAVYAGFPGGKLAAMRADNGKLLWETTVAVPKGVSEIERIADITSLPVIAGPVVYAVAYQGRVAAVDRKNGKVLWNRQISSYTGMNFGDERLYVSHALGSIYSLDYATGRTFWRQGELLNRRITTPTLINNMLVVGDLEGYVHFLDVEDGKFSARVRIDDNAVMSTISGEELSQVIVATRDGGLYAVSVDGTSNLRAKSEEPVEIITETESQINERDVAPITPEEESNEESVERANTDEEEGESRSIMFKKAPDDLLSDEIVEESGPGIVLPKSE